MSAAPELFTNLGSATAFTLSEVYNYLRAMNRLDTSEIAPGFPEPVINFNPFRKFQCDNVKHSHCDTRLWMKGDIDEWLAKTKKGKRR